MGVTISGMTGAGSIRHNNRSFSAANVDRSRTEQNIVFCNEDLKQVYHMVFDEALAAYNAKKTKTRDKIPDYYEHIRQSKQEKLVHARTACSDTPHSIAISVITPAKYHHHSFIQS